MQTELAASKTYRFYFADFFSVIHASPITTGHYGAPRGSAHYKRKNSMYLVAALCLLIHKAPVNFALLGGNQNTLNEGQHQQ
jgi:hypothetical protein